jgi:amino-acid N-acetyltransferase
MIKTSSNRIALVVRAATERDWPTIRDLLREAALPLDGAREHLGDFVVGTIDAQVVCAAGLEIYGADALLRSVVVAERFRGMEYGSALMVKIMQLAKQRGVARLFLLTSTAASYFGALGFVPASREEVPEAVKQSREFQGACPASATLLTAQINI